MVARVSIRVSKRVGISWYSCTRHEMHCTGEVRVATLKRWHKARARRGESVEMISIKGVP